MDMTAMEISEANHPEIERTFQDYISALSNRRKLVISSFIVILLLSILIALGLPAVYKSSATILIEQQAIPQDLVRSTVTSYADQRIQVISQRVMTSTNLWEVIENFNLYPGDRESQLRERVIQKMREDIGLETLNAEVIDPRSGRAVEATIAFTLSYESKNPVLAQRVANELTSLYLNENLKARARMTAETSEFLKEEAGKLAARIASLETNLAGFKQKNVNRLPELTQLNLSLVDRAERELFQTESEIRGLRERKVNLESELAQINPASSVYSENGQLVMSPAGRLKVLEAEYIKLSAAYTPDHPDLVRLDKQISALRQETGLTGSDFNEELQKQLFGLRTELVQAQEKYSDGHPDVVRLENSISELESKIENGQARRANSNALKADNPAYIQLRTQLDSVNINLSGLERKRRQLQDRVGELEKRLMETPQIEREYNELTRDYENAMREYQEIRAKLMDAELAESLEAGRKGERFTLIEPPLLPEKPVKPNRPAIMLAGLILALGGGIGLALLLDMIDGNIHGRRGVLRVLGEIPLVSIPYIRTVEEVRLRNRNLLLTGLVLLAAVLAMLPIFHFVIMPLDTTWFVLLRKLGI